MPPNEVSRKIAVDMMVFGQRGQRSAVCRNLSYNPQYWITIVFSLALLAAYLVILPLGMTLDHLRHGSGDAGAVHARHRHDSGSWSKMPVLKVWLVAARYEATAPEEISFGTRSMVVGASVLALLPTMGSTPYDCVKRVTHKAAVRMGFQNPGSPAGWMQACDPARLRLVYPGWPSLPPRIRGAAAK